MRVLVDADVQHIPACRGKSGHWMTTSAPREYLHRLIAEKVLGRPLPEGALVHHVNEDKNDNRRHNLVVCPDDKYHLLLHARTRVINAGGNPDSQKICGACSTVLSKSLFSTVPKKWDGRSDSCKSCTNARRRGKAYGPWTERRAAQQRLRRAARKALQCAA